MKDFEKETTISWNINKIREIALRTGSSHLWKRVPVPSLLPVVSFFSFLSIFTIESGIFAKKMEPIDLQD